MIKTKADCEYQIMRVTNALNFANQALAEAGQVDGDVMASVRRSLFSSVKRMRREQTRLNELLKKF